MNNKEKFITIKEREDTREGNKKNKKRHHNRRDMSQRDWHPSLRQNGVDFGIQEKMHVFKKGEQLVLGEDTRENTRFQEGVID